MFEPAVKVPMLISQPGRIKENTVCKDLIPQIGLYPTLAELTDTMPVLVQPLAHIENAPEKLDAESFAASVYDPGSEPVKEIFTEFKIKDKGHAQYMLRNGKYKYVYYETGEGMLFDLEKDPGELINLFNDPDFFTIKNELHKKTLDNIFPLGA